MSDDYSVTQRRLDQDYERAAEEFLRSASEAEIQDMKARGLLREVAKPGGGIMLTLADTQREPTPVNGRVFIGRDKDVTAWCDMRADLATTQDFAAACDRLHDELREKYGLSAAVAEAVATFVSERVDRATKEVHALLLARLVGVLIQGTTNQQARAHALMHAVPQLAALNGFPSMRRSAEACGCSVEWIRRMRKDWCTELGMPIPEESSKSEEARTAYRESATKNHWRNRKCQPHPPTKPPQ